MKIESIHPSILSIPFVQSFKHASAERSATQTLWVEAHANGMVGFGEGCPREYVSGEDLNTAQNFVSTHSCDWLALIHDMKSLRDWVTNHHADIDANPAAWTAVELALLDLLGKNKGCSIEALLGVKRLSGLFRYTAVLGDASAETFRNQLASYRKVGFNSFKIKLSGNHARDLIKVRTLIDSGVRDREVRADANNLWNNADVAARYLQALEYRFMALEEPLKANDYEGLSVLAEMLDTPIILDESLLREEQLARFTVCPKRWIVNLRVSKMGGLLRSLNLVETVRAAGLGLIVGAHVGESSLLTRAALTVANSAHDILFAMEGAFGTHLLRHDVVESPVMFGVGGILDVDALAIADKPGTGLEMK